MHVDSCDNSMMKSETEIPWIKFNFCRKFIEVNIQCVRKVAVYLG